jgi:16S rRNA (guanine527-N7)-methyltransferase
LQLLHTYFPNLSEASQKQFEQLGVLYPEWNAKINLISRTDIEHLYERHILHSLAIAKFNKFLPGTKILDIGTGGGFPGIPLAIFFPKVHFTMVDSIGKKIKVVQDIIDQLELKNAVAICDRVENIQGEFDFAVSRATAPLNELYRWVFKKIARKQINAIPNGIICLKGGDIKEEIRPFKGRTEVVPLTDYFKEEFFETKKLVFLTV